MPATYLFHGDLVYLLRRRWRGPQPIVLALTRRTSIKDQVEAFGLPHTEVGRLCCNGRDIDFSHLVRDHQGFDILPMTPPWDVSRPTLLRPDRLVRPAFLVDPTLGRLARALRMAGLNTLYRLEWPAADLLKRLGRSRRVLLSRNLDLLAALSHGSNFAMGCYCEDETRCHRSLLRELLVERGASVI